MKKRVGDSASLRSERDERSRASDSHTPGPWEFRRKSYVYAGNAVVCRVSVQAANFTQSGIQANARLIAAAPDLLAALGLLCNACLDGAGATIRPSMGEVTDARAAIARATGAA